MNLNPIRLILIHVIACQYLRFKRFKKMNSKSCYYLSYIKLELIIFMCEGESTTTVTMTLIVVKMFIIILHMPILCFMYWQGTQHWRKFSKKTIVRLFTRNPNHRSLMYYKEKEFFNSPRILRTIWRDGCIWCLLKIEKHRNS